MWKTKDIYGHIDPLSTSLNLYDKFQFIWQKKKQTKHTQKTKSFFSKFQYIILLSWIILARINVQEKSDEVQIVFLRKCVTEKAHYPAKKLFRKWREEKSFKKRAL